MIERVYFIVTLTNPERPGSSTILFIGLPKNVDLMVKWRRDNSSACSLV